MKKLQRFARLRSLTRSATQSAAPVELAPPFSDVVLLQTTFFISEDGVIESVLQRYHSYGELREHVTGPVD